MDNLTTLIIFEKEQQQHTTLFQDLLNKRRDLVRRHYAIKDSNSWQDKKIREEIALELARLEPVLERARFEHEEEIRLHATLKEIAQQACATDIRKRFGELKNEKNELIKALQAFEKKYRKIESEILQEFGGAYQNQYRIRFKKIHEALRVAGLEEV
jgi:hypothetical protein